MTMPYDDNEPSKYFLNGLLGGGSVYIECQCGNEYYATDNSDGYLNDYPEPPEESDKIFHIPYGSIEFKELDGNVFVLDCKSCMKKLRRYEDFIWYERAAIRQYLKSRIDAEKSFIDYEHLQNVIAGIL